MTRVGIILIATGRYISFFEPVYQSYEKYFLPKYEKNYFLFTDSDKSFHPNVITYKIERKGFPDDTLYRYHHFMKIKKEVMEKVDVVYYTDVDMKAVFPIGDEILPNNEKPLIAVAHPGYFLRNRMGTPENRMRSHAYIDPTEKRPFYVCGGVQGGLTKNYFEASENISNMIDKDSNKDIVAIWHDESYWNRYMVSNVNKFKFMAANYCHPEKTHRFGLGNLQPKILALDKDHSYFRTE
jgi:hypothetical protein